jgi:predicted amidohydrolase YtcJ
LFAEMRELLRKEPSLSPRDVLEMVTVNPAAALGQAGVLGQVRPGAYADLIALPAMGAVGESYESIVGFDEALPWVMVNGEATSIL